MNFNPDINSVDRNRAHSNASNENTVNTRNKKNKRQIRAKHTASSPQLIKKKELEKAVPDNNRPLAEFSDEENELLFNLKASDIKHLDFTDKQIVAKARDDALKLTTIAFTDFALVEGFLFLPEYAKLELLDELPTDEKLTLGQFIDCQGDKAISYLLNGPDVSRDAIGRRKRKKKQIDVPTSEVGKRLKNLKKEAELELKEKISLTQNDKKQLLSLLLQRAKKDNEFLSRLPQKKATTDTEETDSISLDSLLDDMNAELASMPASPELGPLTSSTASTDSGYESSGTDIEAIDELLNLRLSQDPPSPHESLSTLNNLGFNNLFDEILAPQRTLTPEQETELNILVEETISGKTQNKLLQSLKSELEKLTKLNTTREKILLLIRNNHVTKNEINALRDFGVHKKILEAHGSSDSEALKARLKDEIFIQGAIKLSAAFPDLTPAQILDELLAIKL